MSQTRTVGSTTTEPEEIRVSDKFKVKIESTQKCLNISVTAADNDDMEIASKIAIDGFLSTKKDLECHGFTVAPLSNGAKE